MKDRNYLLYLITIIVVIIVYLVIYIFGVTLKKNLYFENTGYQNNTPQQPVNNIFSNHNDDNNKSNNGNGNNNSSKFIIFKYESEEGNYIDLYDQYPVSDDVGKSFSGDKYTHDFKLRFNLAATGVTYVITAKKTEESTLADKWAKIYLTSDGVGIPTCYRLDGKIRTFDEYLTYKGHDDEIVLYQGVVNFIEAQRGYKDFTLRMWVSEDLNISSDDFQFKTFQTKITVYAL